MEKLTQIKPKNLGKIKEKEKVHDTMSELYHKRFENYYVEYDELADAKKDKVNQKFKPVNLEFKDYDYHGWFIEE